MQLRHVSLAPLTAAVLLGLACALSASGTSHAQCDGWLPAPFSPTGLGADGRVLVEKVWDPDGGGPLPALLIVGGDFSAIGGVAANNIAAWDGLVWRPLGSGTDGAVKALTVFGGKLAVGGDFSMAGSAPAAAVATWNGSFWLPCGSGLAGSVRALTEYGGALVAGGDFTGPQSHIAVWYGTAWLGVGPAGLDGSVSTLETFNGDLYAGGSFAHAGSVAVDEFARWDGSNWNHMGDGVYEPEKQCTPEACYPTSMMIWNGKLYVCGGSYWPQVWAWDGANWFPQVIILGGNAYAMTVSGGMLVVTGSFMTDCVDCGAHPLRRIAAWAGDHWVQIGAGIGSPFYDFQHVEEGQALADYGGYLYVGGWFQSANDTPASNIARVHVPGGPWSLPVSPPSVPALAQYGSKLGVGGTFSQAVSNGEAYDLASWDGLTMSTLGAGTNAPVDAMIGYTDGTLMPAQHLIVGGEFTSVDGLPAEHVALWTERDLYPFKYWSNMGSIYGDVFALDRLAGRFVAGGNFTNTNASTAQYVARWDGTGWQPMGTGMNGPVRAFKSYPNHFNYELIAGGDFTTANGSAASHIAIWTENPNGPSTPWLPIGAGFDNSVYAIERYAGLTFAGGAFTASGGVPVHYVAQYVGTQWVDVGGGFNAPVRALRAWGPYLYATGDFTTAGGAPAAHVARWDGAAWSTVAAGADGPGAALLPFGNELLVGGAFQVVGGAFAAPGLARLGSGGLPWLVRQPASQVFDAGQAAAFSVVPVQGYEGSLTYNWRRDEIALADGNTPQGSTVSGAWTANLALAHVAVADSGTYDCVIGDACGSMTSAAATLEVQVPAGVGDDGAGAPGLALAIRPNPMPGSGEIAFTLPRDGRATVDVFDLQGRSLATLADGRLAAGRHRVAWDGTNRDGRRVGAGVFLVRLRVGGGSVSARGMLVR